MNVTTGGVPTARRLDVVAPPLPPSGADVPSCAGALIQDAGAMI